jgi:hypothetical protein
MAGIEHFPKCRNPAGSQEPEHFLELLSFVPAGRTAITRCECGRREKTSSQKEE